MLGLERAERVAIVAAHPDDEVIGAGGLLTSLSQVFVIHTTDGSPLDFADALKNGFASREEYAAARRLELGCALELARIPRENAICLEFTDKETMHHLPELCLRLDENLRRLMPDAVLTQPYEGGHPDHDSTAFAVHRVYQSSHRLFEMTAYHAEPGGAFVTGRFLPNGDVATVRELTPEDYARKQRMLNCFRSQASVLQNFPIMPEQFRRAPEYDFAEPPHAGQLHYERLPWGITGAEWRRLAARCL